MGSGFDGGERDSAITQALSLAHLKGVKWRGRSQRTHRQDIFGAGRMGL